MSWALREGPMSAVESCNGIKMFKIASFLTNSSIVLGIFLVWEFDFCKLCGRNFNFQCESWSVVNRALREGTIRAVESWNGIKIVQNCNLPDQFFDLSWNFPGLIFWFLETWWEELSFPVRILIRRPRSFSVEHSARRRTLVVDLSLTRP